MCKWSRNLRSECSAKNWDMTSPRRNSRRRGKRIVQGEKGQRYKRSRRQEGRSLCLEPLLVIWTHSFIYEMWDTYTWYQGKIQGGDFGGALKIPMMQPKETWKVVACPMKYVNSWSQLLMWLLFTQLQNEFHIRGCTAMKCGNSNSCPLRANLNNLGIP